MKILVSRSEYPDPELPLPLELDATPRAPQ